MVEADRISVLRNTSGVTRTIAIDILTSFDRIGHTTRLFHKINFFVFMVRCFFLFSYFLVVEHSESCLKAQVIL